MMHDETAGAHTRPSEIHVFTEVVVFGPDVAHHVVTVQPDEFDRLRLFGRKDKNRLGRFHDGQNMLLFSGETKSSFDRGQFRQELPLRKHDSLRAFFEAIGYDWRRNRYADRSSAVAA